MMVCRIAALLVLLVAVPSYGYIAVSAERLTLCEVMLEFPNVVLLKVEKSDPTRGAFLFQVVETLHGKAPAGPIRQALLHDGKLPKPILALRPGSLIVSFFGSPDNRTLHLSSGGWYLTKPENGWERFTMLRPDFAALSIDPPERFADAVRNLAIGRQGIVQFRPKESGDEERFFAMYDPEFPHRRRLILDPSVSRQQRPLEQLRQATAAKRPSERANALIELRDSGVPVPTSSCLQMLRDSSAEVRLLAVEVLSTPNQEAAAVVKELANALGDEDRFVCAAAVRGLANYGQAALETLPALTEALKDRNSDHDFRPHRAAEAAETILKLAPQSAHAKSALELLTSDRMLNDERIDSEGTRTAAARALGRCGAAAKPILPQLVKRLHDPLPATRIAAAEAVLKIGASQKERKSAVEVLRQSAREGAANDRIQALKAIRTVQAVELLTVVQEVAKEPHPAIQAVAASVAESFRTR